MHNERDVEFTPSPEMGTSAGGVEFTPAPGLERSATPSAAGEAIDQAKSAAQRVVSDAHGRAAEQVQTQLDSQRTRAAESLSGMAESLRTTGRQLQDAPAGLGAYVQQAAEQVDGLARYLENREVGDLVDDVEDFARRSPGVFLGGAFVLGLLGARFLKSSRRNLVRSEVRQGWSTHQLTHRVDDPTRDAVGRPRAPGYAPPSERSGSEYKAAGPREG
ncbi:MAG: hypothetical protein AB1941_26035 [Gemmatimonadota bacterium]